MLSSSVFVLFPKKGVTDEQAEEDNSLMKKFPIGEQYLTEIDGDVIKTTVIEPLD
jgi:hypothetical protein